MIRKVTALKVLILTYAVSDSGDADLKTGAKKCPPTVLLI